MKYNILKIIVLELFVLNSFLVFAENKNDSVWLFTSFKDPGKSGICFATSVDGLNWTTFNNGKPVMKCDSTKGSMRDPFIVRSENNEFHLIWTSGKGRIGHATSSDLVHWSDQQIIPILQDDKRVLNTWAPEMIFDETNRQWVIFWSSTIKGDFAETDGQVENDKNHRIYYLTTKDWKSFSDPKLFFDPGYPVIDATILKDKQGYLLVFKDERRWPLQKNIRTAHSQNIFGPWTEISEPITRNWTEGPSIIKLKNSFVIYYDAYKDSKKMEAIQSRNLKKWQNLNVRFPDLYKHGSFIRISRTELIKLNNTF